MSLVTAIGCSLSAVTGAYCAIAEPFEAACAAVSQYRDRGRTRRRGRAPSGRIPGGVHRPAGFARRGRHPRTPGSGMTDRPTSVYRLCLVTDRDLSLGRPLVDVVRAAVAGGVTMVQLREKSAGTRAFLDEARALKSLLQGSGVPLIINDRVDIALAVDADGVHVGQSDMPVDIARALIGPGKLIGLSITDERQIGRPDAALADYLGIGPIHPADHQGRRLVTARDRGIRTRAPLQLETRPGDRRCEAAGCAAARTRRRRRPRGRQRHHVGSRSRIGGPGVLRLKSASGRLPASVGTPVAVARRAARPAVTDAPEIVAVASRGEIRTLVVMRVSNVAE